MYQFELRPDDIVRAKRDVSHAFGTLQAGQFAIVASAPDYGDTDRGWLEIWAYDDAFETWEAVEVPHDRGEAVEFYCSATDPRATDAWLAEHSLPSRSTL